MNKEQKKAYSKAYREANKEKIAEQKKRYRENNKEKVAEQKKAHYEANKEEVLRKKKGYYQNNKEKIKDYQKVYNELNKEKVLARNKQYRDNNKEKVSNCKKLNYKANREKILARNKQYREANKEKLKEITKSWYEANKDKVTAYKTNWIRNRRESDSFYRLIGNYRTRTLKAFKSIGQKKNVKSLKLLGLKTFKELAIYFESKFYNHPKTGEKMTFDNHGTYGWHIDHIIPIDSAKTEEDIIKLCHYTNLQPLWAEENLRKSNKILDTE